MINPMTATAHTGFFRLFGKIVLNTLGFCLAIFLLWVGLREITRFPLAEASNSTYYPNFCLGGWKYPQHASGPASADPNDISQFTLKNSAYLQSGVSSQIFCGYFSLKGAKNPPTKATISFNWAMKDPSGAIVTGDEQSATGTVEIDAHKNEPVTVPISSTTTTTVIPAASTTVAPLPAVDVVTPPAPSNGPLPAVQGPTDQTTSSQNHSSQPAADQSGASSVVAPPATESHATQDSTSATQESTVAPSNTPDPTPTVSAPAPSGESSSAPQSFNFLRSLLVSDVYAAEVDDQPVSSSTEPSPNDFFEVSYSVDGIRWVSAGRVNRKNWKNFAITVPVYSWNDLKRLQIMVTTLPTIDEKPDMYLESMSLKVEYDQTFKEMAANGINAVNSAIDSIFGNDGVTESDMFDPFSIKNDEETPRPRRTTATHKERKLIFSEAGSSLIATERILPWYEDEFKKQERTKRQSRTSVDVQAKNDGQSLILKGSCNKAYFVVLMFKSPQDYATKPNSFVSNIAKPCEHGSFSYDHSMIPSETLAGTYYVLVAEEDATGPWVPISDLIPITVQATSTTVTVENDN